MKKFLCMTMLMLAALTASAGGSDEGASPPEQDIGYQQAATLSLDGRPPTRADSGRTDRRSVSDESESGGASARLPLVFEHELNEFTRIYPDFLTRPQRSVKESGIF